MTTIHMPLAVVTLSLVSFPYYSPTPTFSSESPDLGPGTLLGPSGPSVSTTGPTSISYTSSKGSSSSSNSVTPTPIGGHSSNTGAIAGGVVGSIAISIVITALLYYLRRRRPPTPSALSAPSANNGQPGGLNPLMDQLSPRSISGHEAVASSLPETTISLPRPYVRVFVPPCSAYVY